MGKSWRRYGYVAVLAAVASLLLVPVWSTRVAPLSDFHNHLARLYILSRFDEVPSFRAHYVLDERLLPNLALELVGLPLVKGLGLELAARVLLSLTVLVWVGGSDRLGRAVCGRPSARALVCAFFVYDQQFFYGYVGCVLAMGVALWVLAAWVRWMRAPRIGRGVLLAIAGAGVWVLHLSAFATLALAAAGFAAGLRRRAGERGLAAQARRVTLRLLPLAPGVLLTLRAWATTVGERGEVAYPGLGENLRSSLSVLIAYHTALDYGAVVVVVALGAVTLRWASRVRLRPGPAIAAGLLWAAVWLTPSEIHGGAEVNARFVLVATTLLAWTLSLRLPARRSVWVLAALLGLFGFRAAMVARDWGVLSRELALHRAALAHLPRGARVANLFFYPKPRMSMSERTAGLALIHSLCFAVPDREAFVPTLYARRGVQPLVAIDDLYTRHRFGLGDDQRIEWGRLLREYEYVWACRVPPERAEPLRLATTWVASGGECVLYRVTNPNVDVSGFD